MVSEPSPPRLALLGRFGSARLADLLVPHVFAREMAARVPGALVTPLAALGAEAPRGLDGGLGSVPLERFSDLRRETLAAAYDLVVATGTLPLTPEAIGREAGISVDEATRLATHRFFLEGFGGPPAWMAVSLSEAPPAVPKEASAADADTATRLHERTGRKVPLVPHPAILAARLLGAEERARHLVSLAAVAGVPADPFVVVQGGAQLLPRSAALAGALAELREHRLLLLPTDPPEGGAELLETLAERLGDRALLLPPWTTLQDHLALLAGARAFLGTGDTLLVARALGVPVLALGAGDPSRAALFEAAFGEALPLAGRPEEIPARVRGLRATLPAPDTASLDAAFDALARRLLEAHAARVPGGAGARIAEGARREATLRAAHAGLAERLLEQRLRLVDAFEARATALAAETERFAAENATLGRHRDELVAQRDHHAREERLLRESVATVQAEADRLEREREALARHRDHLVAERDHHAAEGHDLRKSLATVQGEAERLERERAELARHRDRLVAERDHHASEERRLAGEAAELGGRLREHDARLRMLEGALADSAARAAALETAARGASTRADALERERDEVRRLAATEREAAERTRAALELRLAAEAALRQALREDLGNARALAERERGEAERERDQARAETAAVAAERDRALGERDALMAEFRRVLNLRVFRWTAPFREAWRVVRRRRGAP